jgi:hypothetical protein
VYLGPGAAAEARLEAGGTVGQGEQHWRSCCPSGGLRATDQLRLCWRSKPREVTGNHVAGWLRDASNSVLKEDGGQEHCLLRT